jgi:hypothetical protein
MIMWVPQHDISQITQGRYKYQPYKYTKNIIILLPQHDILLSNRQPHQLYKSYATNSSRLHPETMFSSVPIVGHRTAYRLSGYPKG